MHDKIEGAGTKNGFQIMNASHEHLAGATFEIDINDCRWAAVSQNRSGEWGMGLQDLLSEDKFANPEVTVREVI